MDPSTVQAIAQAVVDGAILRNPWTYVVLIAVTIVSSAIGGFASAYISKRGENLATKADFEDIKERLVASTETTERIKNEISAQFGIAMSDRQLIREKLERLMDSTYGLELWVEQSRSEALRGKLPNINGTPLAAIQLLQRLYFRDIGLELEALRGATIDIIGYCLEVSAEANAANQERRQMREVAQPYIRYHEPFNGALEALRAALVERHSARAGLQP